MPLRRATDGEAVSGQAHFHEVSIAGGKALEGVARTDVLFDGIPFDVGLAAGVEDAGPVQVSFTYFLHHLLAPADHRHIFEVDDRHTVFDAQDPVAYVTASKLNPEGIQLGLNIARIGFFEQDLEAAFLSP